MNLTGARSIADTVLYEGYLLYPYRSTSGKNSVRWQYGIVGPAGGVEAGVGEEPTLQVHCLVETANLDARVDVHLRFLQIQSRGVEALVESTAEGRPDEFTPVADLQVGDTNWVSWDEAVAQEIEIPDVPLAELSAGHAVEVAVEGEELIELLTNEAGQTVGRVVRKRLPLAGRLELSTQASESSRPLAVLTARLDNTSDFVPAREGTVGVSARDVAVRQSFVGTHLLLAVRGSAFVSLIDPPDWAAPTVATITNRRCWPVLIGDSGDTDLVLASPIILYDYPELAPESPGALYDSTEIDEILTLRIMTLTDEEKAEARATDPRAAAIIDRSDLMPPEVFEKLHGALRSFGGPAEPSEPTEHSAAIQPFDPFGTGGMPSDPDFPTLTTPAAEAGADATADAGRVPWWGEEMDAGVMPDKDSVRIGQVDVAKGSRVRLRPNRRADAQDLFIADRTAIVTKVYSDVDGNTHVAVVLEDDEMSEIHDWYGRYYYFAPDELEPLNPRSSAGHPDQQGGGGS
ncbi:MAG: hypothetical protein M3O55_06800 [Actinomycetota bacterium]|nr:hypothetical protein [Actinomycetota bacterium]